MNFHELDLTDAKAVAALPNEILLMLIDCIGEALPLKTFFSIKPEQYTAIAHELQTRTWETPLARDLAALFVELFEFQKSFSIRMNNLNVDEN
jgi:hypothetical protein